MWIGKKINEKKYSLYKYVQVTILIIPLSILHRLGVFSKVLHPITNKKRGQAGYEQITANPDSYLIFQIAVQDSDSFCLI